MPELTPQERAALDRVRFWLRRIYLEGPQFKTDGIERDQIELLLLDMDALTLRLTEPNGRGYAINR